jgi:hypothetical protein
VRRDSPGSLLLALSIYYRSGRWRSEYVIDLDENKVDGKILANVHYYEQGNVRPVLITWPVAEFSGVIGSVGYGSHALNIITFCRRDSLSGIICIEDPRPR